MIEEDLTAQCLNSYVSVRTKIGVIGYTNTGKGTLLNRLLGVTSLDEAGVAPASLVKSTYFPLRFDRQPPLIHPEDQNKNTRVTLVDSQGQDRNRPALKSEVEAGNYLDEIRKADCDIYILVIDEELHEEQQKWIDYIEQEMKRKCVLTRSKVDLYYLAKFRQLSDTIVQSRNVYLVATNYTPENGDAELLLESHSFDLPELLKELSCLAFNARRHRIHALSMRTVAVVVNTCFRRGYAINVLKYKIAAGVAAVMPVGDQIPRYFSRENIRQAFGINDSLREYLKQHHIMITNYTMQTSVFKDYIEVSQSTAEWTSGARPLGTAVGNALVATSTFADDIIRVVARTVISLSNVARMALTAAFIGIGVSLSVGVSAWSAVSIKNHIFSYTIRVCDDLIQVIDSIITSIIEREQDMIVDDVSSTALISNINEQ
ncbi:unnamed protein product [Rotaria magnacalcarata]|uniref:G domain-containing protein n=1 Tax=Rotaria magnacalcarata TaxID=392030 RepID=A0A819B0J4_9BILA|nr:unnamed protein product [Rotaria magnacalcarata]CAF3793675.1 unnamed protein product [Rotaria magnacalcarata]